MTSRLNKINNYILPTYLIITFSVFLSYAFRYGRGDYNFSEYLVNYSSGFVRRGLPGEIFLSIPNISRDDIFFILLAIHSFAFIANYFLVYKISKKIGLSELQVIIIMLHPSLVGFYSWSYSNAFKKDLILEVFILLIVNLFLSYFNKNSVNKLITFLILSLIAMPFFMLVHEIIFFLSAVIYIVIFFRIFFNSDLRHHITGYHKKITIFVSVFVLNCLLFIVLISAETEYDPIKTFQSVNRFMPLSYGPFPPLTNETQHYSNPVMLKLQDTENLVTYSLGFLAAVAIFYISLCLNQQKLFFILLLINSPIFFFSMIFSDWDRIIVFWSFSFFATYCLYSFKDTTKLLNFEGKKLTKFFNSKFFTITCLPGLFIFLMYRVPTGNPARFEEISMFWKLIENVTERLRF
jgi:hypothetical protein